LIRQNLAYDVPAQDVVHFSLNFTKGLRYGDRTIFHKTLVSQIIFYK